CSDIGEGLMTRAVGESVTFQLKKLDGKSVVWNFGNGAIATVIFGDPPDPVRAVGESVTFQLERLNGKSVAWNFGNDAIATVIFGDPPDPAFVKEDYKPRLTFPKNGTALTISQLTMDDAGTYVADTNLLKITFTLHVYSTYSSRQALIVVSVIGAAVLLAAIVFVVCCTRRGWRIFHLPTAKPTDTGARAGAEDSTVYAQVGPSQQRDLQNFSNTQQDDPKKAPIPDMDNSRTIYFTVQAVPQTDDEKMGNNVPGCRKQDEKSHHLLVS
ncbi:PREDICTED: uncharacterized protein LOC104374582, partial [Tauraco erythrolophus]|uniref:uncharacterized protein LOC104374582 n=1 Tax=Tauraco erythrolophus TaxID=121530 RepID=UPI0005236769